MKKVSAVEYFKSLDLSKIDPMAAQYIRESVLTMPNINLLEGTKEFEELQSIISEEFPEALGIKPKEVEPAPKEFEKPKPAISDEDLKKLKQLEIDDITSQVTKMEEGVEFLREVLTDGEDALTRERLEFLEETLLELKAHLKDISKFEDGGDIKQNIGKKVLIKHSVYSNLNGKKSTVINEDVNENNHIILALDIPHPEDNNTKLWVNIDEVEFLDEYKNGGPIKDQYKGLSESNVWADWNVNQRRHFLEDHQDKINEFHKNEGNSNTELNAPEWATHLYFELPSEIKKALKEHTSDGEYSEGGEINNINVADFEKKIKDLLKQENKWHFVGDVVDGKKVRMKFFVGKKEVDVQIFTIDNLAARMPRNYSGKRDTLAMIMDNFK